MSFKLEELKDAIKTSYNIHEVLNKLKGNTSGSAYSSIKRLIKLYNIDISHFNDIDNVNNNLPRRTTTYKLRKFMLLNNILYKCAKCGQDEFWNNNTLVLEINHKDGNRYNNDISNLEFLCPNCHNVEHHRQDKLCQCGKKIGPISKYCQKCANIATAFKRHKVKWPTVEELEHLVKILPMTKIAKKYNVSDKTIKKWCEQYQIVVRKRGKQTL